MKAMQIKRFGDTEVLELVEIPKPEPKSDEVLIRIEAAGVNPIDWKTRQGNGFFQNDSLPLILGWDMSGVIERIGNQVSNFKVGDEVFGMLAFPGVGATNAEYAVSSPNDIAIKPKGLSHEQAAALPLAVLTAWQGLIEQGDLQGNEKVLIHAAGGGVGHLAVQLAKWKGAHVIGTASAANHDLLRQLGVDECIDHKTTQFESVVSDLDMVFDAVGGDVTSRSLSVLKSSGRLVTLLGHRNQEAMDRAKQLGVATHAVIVHPSGEQLAQISELVETNQLKPVVDQVFKLDEVKQAHQYLEKGHARGKVVLKIAE